MTDSQENPPRTESVLRRLLGPAGPELTCDQCFEMLDEYVELELAATPAAPTGTAAAAADDAIPGMRAHLEGCPACREEHDSLLALLASDKPA